MTRKINTEKQIVDLFGEPMMWDASSKKKVTVGNAIVFSLINSEEANKDAEDKLKNFALASKVALGGDIELTDSEVSTIMKYANGFLGVLVYGRLAEELKYE